jgi:hypothetical protein
MTFPVVVQALWGPISIDARDIESAEHTPIGGDNVRLNMAGGSFITITAGSARALRAIGVVCLDDAPEPAGKNALCTSGAPLSDFRGDDFLPWGL